MKERISYGPISPEKALILSEKEKTRADKLIARINKNLLRGGRRIVMSANYPQSLERYVRDEFEKTGWKVTLEMLEESHVIGAEPEPAQKEWRFVEKGR